MESNFLNGLFFSIGVVVVSWGSLYVSIELIKALFTRYKARKSEDAILDTIPEHVKSSLAELLEGLELPDGTVLASIHKFKDSYIGTIIKGDASEIGKYYFLESTYYDGVSTFKGQKIYIGREWALREPVPPEYLDFIKFNENKNRI